MALPQDGQNANGLTKVTQIPAGKELMFIDPTTNEGGIITLEDLTKQILSGITSQAFNLDAGQMTLIQALNDVNRHNSYITFCPGYIFEVFPFFCCIWFLQHLRYFYLFESPGRIAVDVAFICRPGEKAAYVMPQSFQIRQRYFPLFLVYSQIIPQIIGGDLVELFVQAFE